MMNYNKHVLRQIQNTTKYLLILCPILSVCAFMHRVEPKFPKNKHTLR